MFGLTVVTAPAIEPVTLPEAKRQCRIADSIVAFDVELNALIIAARRYCEIATGKAFITQTLRLTLDRFPGWRDEHTIRLPRGPLQTVSSIQYTDSAGVTQTVAAASYVVDASGEVGRVALADGYEWPTDAIEQIAAVKVNYVAGYGLTAASVPQTIRQAMLLLIGHWFANKEAVGAASKEIEFSVSALLGCEWTGSLAGAYG
ncbi:MAG TPA: head-tail connector protein [Planctomycetaceae bacterium]|nr:head-tail connector protein [Planctomycetaceae bacterium]